MIAVVLTVGIVTAIQVQGEGWQSVVASTILVVVTAGIVLVAIHIMFHIL